MTPQKQEQTSEFINSKFRSKGTGNVIACSITYVYPNVLPKSNIREKEITETSILLPLLHI